MDEPAFRQPLHIVIRDNRLRKATQIAAARTGLSIRAYLTRLLMADDTVQESLAYVDSLTGEGKPRAMVAE
jgi:hypothetical protein